MPFCLSKAAFVLQCQQNIVLNSSSFKLKLSAIILLCDMPKGEISKLPDRMNNRTQRTHLIFMLMAWALKQQKPRQVLEVKRNLFLFCCPAISIESEKFSTSQLNASPYFSTLANSLGLLPHNWAIPYFNFEMNS